VTFNPVDDQRQRFRRKCLFDRGVFGRCPRVGMLEQMIQLWQFPGFRLSIHGVVPRFLHQRQIGPRRDLQILLAIGISAALCLVTWIWARRCRTSVSHGKGN